MIVGPMIFCWSYLFSVFFHRLVFFIGELLTPWGFWVFFEGEEIISHSAPLPMFLLGVSSTDRKVLAQAPSVQTGKVRMGTSSGQFFRGTLVPEGSIRQPHLLPEEIPSSCGPLLVFIRFFPGFHP